MLDERFAERMRQLDAATSDSGEPVAQARQAGLDFARNMAADPEWNRLFFEFTAYAARNQEFREELVTRYRSLREYIADIYRRRAEDLGGPPPVSSDQIALMTFAMANGVALEGLLEPELVTDDLFATMLQIFMTGLQTLAESSAPVDSAAAADRPRHAKAR